MHITSQKRMWIHIVLPKLKIDLFIFNRGTNNIMNYPIVFNYPTTALTTRPHRPFHFKIYMDVNPNKHP